MPRPPVVERPLDRQHGAADQRRSARAQARLVRLGNLPQAQRQETVEAMSAEDEIGPQRQDVPPHPLEVVFERVGFGSGVDDLDRPAAIGAGGEQSLELLRPGLLAVAQRRTEGLRLAERDDAEPVALLGRDLGAAKARGVDPDRRVEHPSRASRHEDERQLLLGIGLLDRAADAVVADPFVEIIEPPHGEGGRDSRAQPGRNRSARRPNRRSALRSRRGRAHPPPAGRGRTGRGPAPPCRDRPPPARSARRASWRGPSSRSAWGRTRAARWP